VEEEANLKPKSLPQFDTRARFRPYYSLLWLSRKLGHAATNTSQDVKALLKKDMQLALPSRTQLIGSRHSALPIKIDSQQQSDPTPKRPEKSLQQIVEESHEILAKATTVFPFTLFPDKVVLDRTKVTIVQRNFFWSEDMISIRIEDVLNVRVTTDMMFGSLSIASRVMNSTDHFQIKFLWKKDALHLKHIIQGYVIAQHNKIQLSHLPKDELIKNLIELGHDTAS